MSGPSFSERSVALWKRHGRGEPCSLERSFYLGVDAAAQEVLHPALGMARAEKWLDSETAAFREGYLRTSDLLATAKTAVEPPMRLPLPEFSTRP